MATRDQLIQALRAADAAGDTEGASRIVSMMNATPALEAEGPKAPSRAEQLSSQFEAMPWYSKLGTAADDVVRLGAEGASFGFADKAAARLNTLFSGDYGTELEAQRLATQDAKDRAGWAGTAAEVGGAVASPVMGVVGAVGRLAGIPRAVSTVGRIGQGTTAGALEGAGAGALTAAGHDTDIAEGSIGGAGAGALFGAIAPAVGQLAGKATSFLDNVVPRRSVDELRTAKNAAYDAVDQAGVAFSPLTTGSTAGNMRRELMSEGIDPIRHERALSMAHEVNNRLVSGRPVTLSELDKMRQAIMRDTTVDAANKHYGDIMVRHIDDMIENTPQGGLTGGTAGEGHQLFGAARDANRRYRSSETVQNAVEKGVDKGQQGQIELRGILANPKKSRFLTQPERDQMRTVVRGSGKQKAADIVGGLGGGANYGLGLGVGSFGALTANPVAVAAGAGIAGMGALGRAAGRAERRKGISDLLDIIDGQASRSKSRIRIGIEDAARPIGQAATLAEIIEQNRKKRKQR